jgi:hypothetical protein
MKSFSLYLLIAGLVLLAGCEKSLDWTRLDGSSPTAEQLEKASKTCRIEIKLAGLERAQEARDTDLDKASTDQAKMRVKDEFDQLRLQVYREIDSCMNKQGYRR